MSHITPNSCVAIIILLTLGILLVSLVPLVKSEEDPEEVEIFYARDPLKIQQLSLLEDILVTELSQFVSQSSKEDNNSTLCFDYLQKYIQEYEEDWARGVGGKRGWIKARKIADNPLLNFKMVKRSYLTLTKGVMIFCQKSSSGKGVREKIEEIFEGTDSGFPVERDWDDALKGIVILQFVYQLKTEELRLGILNGRETNVVLYGDHCVAIANKALEMEGAVLAYQWLKQAEQSYLQERSVNKNQVDLERSWERLIQLTKLQSVEQLHRNMTNAERQERLKGLSTYKRHAPCRGEMLMNLKEQAATLKCVLYTEGHPYFAINPLKIEILSERHMYLQLHDFVGATAIETLKKLETEDDMRRNENNTSLLSLLKIIEMTTGLRYARWRTGYWYSTISTPLGGYCNVQSLRDDKYQPAYKEIDKLTTLLFFLSDVEMGGYVSFQKAGIAAKPVKGSALFYYNSPDEMMDLDKTIVRCPVLMGSQETATQWMLKSENKAA